jgi:hypothetical protein
MLDFRWVLGKRYAVKTYLYKNAGKVYAGKELAGKDPRTKAHSLNSVNAS